MLIEILMEEILQFIYIGSVQIIVIEKVEDLIMVVDYLCFLFLKIFVGKFLGERLLILNCVLIYYFVENYFCKELVVRILEFIYWNFVVVVNEDKFFRLLSY